MPQGSNTVQVEYKLLKAPPAAKPVLEVRPLIAFRDYHSTMHENDDLNPTVYTNLNVASIQPYTTLPRFHFAHNADGLERESYWYRNFLYREERARGLDFIEDLFSPFAFSWRLSLDRDAQIIASTDLHDIREASTLRRTELKRRQKLAAAAPVDDPLAKMLAVAADQFLARRGDDWTVIAGYPWFTDWGRDTMISLPGLTLLSGRADVAKSILRNFARHTDQGMLPNRFVDSGEQAEFNTVDATLWFFEAARACAAVSGDYDFLRAELYPVLTKIIDFHVNGTRYNIKMAENGLLNAGAPGAQLTWMDAKVGDWVVTPRMGKPVEIQALWYNALRIMEDLAKRFGHEEHRRRYSNMACLVGWTFNRLFWNKECGCLYDVVNGGPPDPSVRPNQILAVSLHHSMLARERARAVVATVQRELLTPVGLRTLSPSDSRYRSTYEGNAYSRDSAYHQGTVWPWLMGPFITAYIRVNDGSRQAREYGRHLLHGLEEHLVEAGLGQVSEIFDAGAPYPPRGCFAQAWSVAEIMRALCEDVYQMIPASGNTVAAAG
jgi:predicted glycogen debranching enzyme